MYVVRIHEDGELAEEHEFTIERWAREFAANASLDSGVQVTITGD